MVNKMTIEAAYKIDPFKSYYVIQNPRVDKKSKKLRGLTIKSVEYRVKDWDNKEIRFEKVDQSKNKRFPNIINFDKRYPDAENEVYADRVSKAQKKPEIIDSYGIFIDAKMAKYNKLIRLHRIAEDMMGIYKALKKQKEGAEKQQDENISTDVKQTDSDDSKGSVVSKEAEKEIKEGVDTNKVDLTIEEVRGYFDTIQDTNYFEMLESIQSDDPSLATR